MQKTDARIPVAIIGSGNIGTDLMIKVMRNSRHLSMAAMVGIDPQSDGLARAARLGAATTAQGIDGLVALPCFKDIGIVFDATSAGAHARNNEILQRHGKRVVALPPPAIGPYVVPVVNMEEHLDAPNLNMVTCGGQATIPMVAAVSRVQNVAYGEIVATVSSRSVGPGTRKNIDEFTRTTAGAVEKVGGAKKGKAIIVINPAEPPLIMRDTVYTLSELADEDAIAESVARMAAAVQSYVPGYRLKQAVQFERIEQPIRIPGVGGVNEALTGLKTSIFLEVEGAAHYLPAYAGNLDIMTSAGLRTAEHMAARMLAAAIVAA